jgi:hypothetical protein
VKESAARQQQQRSEASKRGWQKAQQAFAQAAADKAAQKEAEKAGQPQPRHAHGDDPLNQTWSAGDRKKTWTEGFGPRRAADAWADTGSAEANASSPEAGRAGPKAEARKSGREGGGAKSGNGASSHPTAPSSNDPPELRKLKTDIEKKLRSEMDADLADRKKVVKDLMLEYHPDKNSSQYAKEVFQYINASKGWFLHET